MGVNFALCCGRCAIQIFFGGTERSGHRANAKQRKRHGKVLRGSARIQEEISNTLGVRNLGMRYLCRAVLSIVLSHKSKDSWGTASIPSLRAQSKMGENFTAGAKLYLFPSEAVGDMQHTAEFGIAKKMDQERREACWMIWKRVWRGFCLISWLCCT